MTDSFDPALAAPPGYVAFVDEDLAEAVSDERDEAAAECFTNSVGEDLSVEDGAQWEMSENEVAAQVPREANSSPVEATDVAEAPEMPKEVTETLSEAVEAAEGAPAQIPSGVREAPAKRTHTRGGEADFGGLRQPKDSATSSASLFAKLLEHGEAKVMLDGEAKACGKVRPGEMDKLRKAALNRILNRLLKGGGFERKYGNAKGCIATERVNAQTVILKLLKAPVYITVKGKPTACGKVALALHDAGTEFHAVATDDELDKLITSQTESAEVVDTEAEAS